MAHRLTIGRIASSSRLSTGLTSAEAADIGEFADGVLVVDTAAEAADLVDRYHNVDWADGPPIVDDATTTEAPFDPGDLTVTELRDHLGDADPSRAELEALRDAERDGRDRATALDVIDTQLE